MPFYQKRRQIPEKRHIQFYDESGDLYWEELISREGFGWIYSNVYHINPPTAVSKVGKFRKIENIRFWENQPHHLLKSDLDDEEISEIFSKENF